MSYDLSGSLYLFINGLAAGSTTGYQLNKVLRETNYIGHGNWGDSNLNAVLDEFKIYNRPLSLNKIATEMNKPQPLNIIQF